MVDLNHALIRERRALKLSLAGTIVMSGFGIGYGLLVGSNHFYGWLVFFAQHGHDRVGLIDRLSGFSSR